jgi:hypothetical protein
VVVGDAAVLDAAVVVDERVGRARVAVERQPDAAGVDQLDAVRGASEGQVGVAEDQAGGRDALEELGLVVARLGEEGTDVRDRRAVADQRVALCRRLRERRELGDERLAERLARRLDRSPQELGRVVRVLRPALAVAADPERRQLAQPIERLARPAAEERVVAAEDEAVGFARVGEYGLERRQLPCTS